MDHEFGTSFLEEGQAGWDWFSIQLEDGTDLMLFQLRKADGRDSRSSGTWVDVSGHATPLQMRDFEMKGTQLWQSDQSGAQYPTKWEIQCAPLRLNLTVQPTVFNQELRTKESTGVNYWEGAVEITGTREGRPVKGRGYLEMTGYGGQVMSRLLGINFTPFRSFVPQAFDRIQLGSNTCRPDSKHEADQDRDGQSCDDCPKGNR